MIALIKNSNMFLKDRPLLFMYSTCAIDSPGHNQKLFLLIYMWLQFNFTRPRMHYGSFRQNLSKNSYKCYYCKVIIFFATNCLKMHQRTHENWKRPMKVAKTFSKARESNNEKLMIFFHSCSHWVSIIVRNQYFYIPRSPRPKRPHL